VRRPSERVEGVHRSGAHARKGLRAFEHESWKRSQERNGTGERKRDPDYDTGGGACPTPIANQEAVGAITYNETQHCTGTLIAPTVVLTAAHCVDRFDATNLEFRSARTRQASRRQVRESPQGIPHGWYLGDRLGWNDIAVLYLEKQLRMSPRSTTGRSLTRRSRRTSSRSSATATPGTTSPGGGDACSCRSRTFAGRKST